MATVHSFSDERKPFSDIPIGTIATTWTNESDGTAYLLVIPEALYFGDRLGTSLICPNQLRSYGVTVEDTPRMYNPNSKHSIITNEFTIPLHVDGVISYVESRKPTQEEVETLLRIQLTSDTKWDPRDPSFAMQEKAAIDRGISATTTTTIKTVYSDVDRCTFPEFYNSNDLHERLISCVYISYNDIKYIENDEVLDTSDLSSDTVYSINAITTNAKPIITKEILARRWGIGIKAAEQTLKNTTQRGLRTFANPIDRRLSTHHPHLSFPIIKRKMYSDTMFSKIKSLHLHTCAQVWTDGLGYTLFYPLKSKAFAHTTISTMISDLNAIPITIITDGAKEESEGKWKKEIQHYRIKQQHSEPYSQWQNRAESEIRELKRIIRKTIARSFAPKRLWDYCGLWAAAIRRRTCLEITDLNGTTPEENVNARQVDISAYAQFDFYSYVWYIDYPTDVATSRRQIGRWLGVAENVGSSLCYTVLPSSCRPIYRSSVTPICRDEQLQPEIQQQIQEFDNIVRSKIGNDRSDIDIMEEFPDMPAIPDDIFIDDEHTETTVLLETIAEADDWTPESYDNYIAAQVVLPRGDHLERATVKRRKRDDNNNPIGIRNQNPILDTREYEVEFPDGSIDILSANAISEAMYLQLDNEGNEIMLIAQIIDHRKDGSAVHADDGFVKGTQQRRWTTKGWQLLVEWKDRSTDWIDLKDLKDSNPVHVAEYAATNKLLSEPAFAWWAPKALKQRDRNILKVRSRYILRTHKFGIEIPKTIKRALEIDKENGNDFWRLAIEKEMKNVGTAFEIQENGVAPPGYNLIPCHMIFDIKMDFTRKARFVAGGHKTDPPKESVYSSVVTRESVRLFFLLAALNDLEVLSCDVQNAYLNAGTNERNYFIAGLELGKANVGLPVKIVKALYGLRSSGAQWREHMANTLRTAGFTSCKADADVWFRPAVKKNGDKYYEYVLCYVDDILCCSENPKAFMEYLASVYTLKPGSVKEPDVYLGADIKKFPVGVERSAWGISPDSYCKSAVREVERKLEEIDKKLAKKVKTPMSSGYRAELDSSAELSPDLANYYQSLIGSLRWAVELGRIDIIVEVSMLARYCVSPRLGHLDQALHIFAYLKRHSSCSMVFDHREPAVDESIFKTCSWKSQYPDAKESIPPNMPEPRGKSVITTCYVDADHAGCLATRRSTTGVIIYVNNAPIVWYSKRQNTVESSTFGSEFVALRQAIDLVEGLRYKLRMMGVDLDPCTSIYCDNDSVVKSTTSPESQLKKKHNAICYHRSREAEAAGHVRVGKILGTDNNADAFTKVIVGAHRLHLHRKLFLYPPGEGNFGTYNTLPTIQEDQNEDDEENNVI